MTISIITINWNNAAGLEQTMKSVVEQTATDFEYVVVDGASTDGSLEVIKKYAQLRDIRWVSEPDKGIYNAMNKGIRMAQGEYVMMLNSGDSFYRHDVVSRLLDHVSQNENKPSILLGNLVDLLPNGQQRRNHGNTDYRFISLFRSTLNHPGCLIRKSLFDEFGYYDESYRIVADWAWFLDVVGLKGFVPQYCDIDTVLFDTTGISSSNKKLLYEERYRKLQSLLPDSVLKDLYRYDNDMRMVDRLHRHPLAFKLVRFIERILFKYEQHQQKKNLIR